MCLSVTKDLANWWNDMVLLYSVASYITWEDYLLFFLGGGEARRGGGQQHPPNII